MNFSGRNARAFPLWLFLTALPIASTLFFSSQNAETSGSLSLRVLSYLLTCFPFLTNWTNISVLHVLVRKLAHFTLYFIFGCGLRGLYSYQKRAPVAPAAIVTGALYAALDEFHQRFTEGRAPSLWDVALDTCGVAVGCAAVSLIFLLLARGKQSRAS